MRIWTFALLATVAACTSPASDNQTAVNDQLAANETSATDDRLAANASAVTSNIAEGSATPPADDVGAAKPIPPVGMPAPPPPIDKAAEPAYAARGQEPGWALNIANGRIDYQGNYGEKRIRVAAPAAQAIRKGRRYVTPRLTVEIADKRCNDAMSGQGYEDTVKVIADGETYEGCGGKRRPDLDM